MKVRFSATLSYTVYAAILAPTGVGIAANVVWPSAVQAQNDLAEIANIFVQTVAEHYGVPEQDAYSFRDRGLRAEELPVVYYLAREAQVAPQSVLDRRLQGDPWLAIARKLGLSPELFYVEVPSEVVGPPYGNAYGYWKQRPRSEWNRIELSDDEIIDLVNLRFVTQRYDYNPVDVIRDRTAGQTFVTINSELYKRGKSEKAAKAMPPGQAKKAEKSVGGPKQAKAHKNGGKAQGKGKEGKGKAGKGGGSGKDKGKKK